MLLAIAVLNNEAIASQVDIGIFEAAVPKQDRCKDQAGFLKQLQLELFRKVLSPNSLVHSVAKFIQFKLSE